MSVLQEKQIQTHSGLLFFFFFISKQLRKLLELKTMNIEMHQINILYNEIFTKR